MPDSLKSDPVPDSGPVILDAAAVARTVDRLAHQIAERADRSLTDLVVIGLPTRGVPLAQRLATRIGDFTGHDVPLGALDTTLYRDDLRLHGVRPLAQTVEPRGGITGRRVLLVDDVLFSGRTVRAALDAVRDLGRPDTVELVVLVDRGHRELPIRADYVGKNVPTSRTQSVRVHLVETDGADAVLIDEPDADSAS